MTTITIATIEATIRNRIMNDGTVMVRINDDVMNQMNEIVKEVREVTGFDESKMTADDLEFSMNFAGNFKNSSIGSKVTDGWLVRETDAHIEEARAAIREDLVGAPCGILLPVILVNKILNETRCYAL